MNAERWQQVRSVLEAALPLDSAQRRAYLDRACASDQSLRDEVESLLDADQEAQSFLQLPIDLRLKHAQQESAFWVGRRIGSYEITEIIGEGGMGAVYRAARADEQYQKQVAIKIVKRGLSTPFALARFRAERQILATLEHPNIARLLDGGTTDNGVPYIVMELVEGKPIDEYCAANQLSIEQRLRLFRTVCLAVQYAHQHLVVHRDLKPGNILVTADGTPKLLDFGIAKILDTGLFRAGAEPTVSFLRMLTPEYASPEQVRGETVTTASDVYSLGVVLFLLLTGRHPYQFDRRSADSIVRAVCDTEPLKPSTAARPTAKIGSSRDSKPSASERTLAAEGYLSNKLSNRLRGDLDNIVLMALRKEPQRRYASAEQFAEDIRRHLENLPVAARNDTVGYRASKFVARHKVGTAATATAVVALLAAMFVAVYEARIAEQQAEVAREQRARAEKRFNDVRKLANSLLFDLHDTIQDLPGSTPARKLIVQESLEYLDSLSAESDDPSLLRELATAYERVGELQGHYLADNLGETSNSLVSYRKALDLWRRLAEEENSDWQDHLSLAEMYRRMASQTLMVGNTGSAVEFIHSATAITESLSRLRENDPKVLSELAYDYKVRGHIQSNAFFASQDDLGAALESFKQATATDERLLALDQNNISAQSSVADDRLLIANTEKDLDQRLDSLANYNRALQGFLSVSHRSNAVRDRRKVAVVYNHLAIFYGDAGNWKLASENYQKGLGIYKELAAQDPKNVLVEQGLAIAYVNAGDARAMLGYPREGLADIYRGLRIMGSILSADPNAEQRGVFAQMHITLANDLAGTNRYSDARREYEVALRILEDMRPDANDVVGLTSVAECKVGIADAQRHLGDLHSAATNFRAALSLTSSSLKPTDHGTVHNAIDAHMGLGDIETAWALQSPSTEQSVHWENAVRWYQQGFEMWNQLPPYARLDSRRFRAAEVKKRLQEAQSNLGARLQR